MEHVIRMHREKLSDLRRRCREAIEQLSDEEVNWRPNPESNSVANLVVHMAGNLHQRFAAGIGGAPDRRDRDAEFDETVYQTREQVLAALEKSFGEADEILAALTPDRLGEPQMIRHRQVTVLDVIFTVAAHLSEHVGQILYIAKMHRGDGFRNLSVPRKPKE